MVFNWLQDAKLISEPTHLQNSFTLKRYIKMYYFLYYSFFLLHLFHQHALAQQLDFTLKFFNIYILENND